MKSGCGINVTVELLLTCSPHQSSATQCTANTTNSRETHRRRDGLSEWNLCVTAAIVAAGT
jgi:hypothetical protein